MLLKVTFGDVMRPGDELQLQGGPGRRFDPRRDLWWGREPLDAGQADLRVSRYFEAAVAVGDLPDDARPYRFENGDFWDEEFLFDEMNLDEALVKAGYSRSGQLGAGPDLDYFSGLAKRNVDFMRRYLKLPAEELLIGFTVAENAGANTLERAFTRAFDLRDDGGAMGIVASIMEAPRGPLVAELRELVVGTGVAGGGDSGADDWRIDLRLRRRGPDRAMSAIHRALGPQRPHRPTDR